MDIEVSPVPIEHKPDWTEETRHLFLVPRLPHATRVETRMYEFFILRIAAPKAMVQQRNGIVFVTGLSYRSHIPN